MTASRISEVRARALLAVQVKAFPSMRAAEQQRAHVREERKTEALRVRAVAAYLCSFRGDNVVWQLLLESDHPADKAYVERMEWHARQALDIADSVVAGRRADGFI